MVNDDSFPRDALQYLRAFALRYRWFPAFVVVRAAQRRFPGVSTRRWGPVIQRAADQGWIRPTDRTMRHPRRHGCPALIWASEIVADRVAH